MGNYKKCFMESENEWTGNCAMENCKVFCRKESFRQTEKQEK